MPEIFVPGRDSSIVVLGEHPESSCHGSVATFTGLARIRVNAATPRNCGTNFYRVTLCVRRDSGIPFPPITAPSFSGPLIRRFAMFDLVSEGVYYDTLEITVGAIEDIVPRKVGEPRSSQV